MRRAEWLFFAAMATALLIPALIGTVFKYACEGAARRARRIKDTHLSRAAANEAKRRADEIWQHTKAAALARKDGA